MVAVDLQNYKNRHSLKSKIMRMLWDIVWLFLFRPTPRWCLNGWRSFLLRVFGAQIGSGARIQGSVKIWQPWNLVVGNDCWIDGEVSLYSVDKIVIGSNVVISNGAFICTASHDISSKTFSLVSKPVEIRDCAWVCARTIVLPGVTIGEGAVTGAGAVVTKNVEAWTVIGGNPAEKIGHREIKND